VDIYIFVHQLSSVPIVEEVPISKDRIAQILFCHLVDLIDRERSHGRPIAHVDEGELAETLREVIDETRE